MDREDQDFCYMVAYFWLEKGDPTRYSSWNTARCKELMPEFAEMYSQYLAHKNMCSMIARQVINDKDDLDSYYS